MLDVRYTLTGCLERSVDTNCDVVVKLSCVL